MIPRPPQLPFVLRGSFLKVRKPDTDPLFILGTGTENLGLKCELDYYFWGKSQFFAIRLLLLHGLFKPISLNYNLHTVIFTHFKYVVQ